MLIDLYNIMWELSTDPQFKCTWQIITLQTVCGKGNIWGIWLDERSRSAAPLGGSPIRLWMLTAISESDTQMPPVEPSCLLYITDIQFPVWHPHSVWTQWDTPYVPVLVLKKRILYEWLMGSSVTLKNQSVTAIVILGFSLAWDWHFSCTAFNSTVSLPSGVLQQVTC